ncbi:hypothetical protein PSYJA_08363 [Pseudomonas syringae pv. japonica str. M301072]|uniref:Uncharacterized protein n=1 Tax=Pseudomonas syringae pv. japonica str. M301072 TaxID=629262 RepID=F3FFJ4_PSESX|nr:hypothetical protein PSYJA_08363 [Pseudomonas syringae pv. japonica str. M301072]
MAKNIESKEKFCKKNICDFDANFTRSLIAYIDAADTIFVNIYNNTPFLVSFGKFFMRPAQPVKA